MAPNSLASSLRQAWGLACSGKDQPLVPWAFKRRALRSNDVAVRITYCGVCHTDLHAIQGGRAFPVVPGHEMVGEVTEVAAQVSRFAVATAWRSAISSTHAVTARRAGITTSPIAANSRR